VSRKLCEDGHDRQAAFYAYIRVIEAVKEKYGLQDDGDSLLNRAFGCDRQTPFIQFNYLAVVTQEWLNEIARVQFLLRLSPRLRAKHGD
jgi:hypothetical protein